MLKKGCFLFAQARERLEGALEQSSPASKERVGGEREGEGEDKSVTPSSPMEMRPFPKRRISLS